MYMTNEKWEQNNQGYLKESYEETGLPPEDTPSANLSAAAAVGCSTPPSTPRNTVTATGAAIRPTICGSGNTAKCAVRIWSASAAVKNSRPNVQMPAIAATPADKKSIENVLQMLQVLKMSTSFFVPSQGLLKIRCRHPALDFTRNRISWSFWPTEKAGRAVRSGQFARSKSAEVRVASGDLKRPQAF